MDPRSRRGDETARRCCASAQVELSLSRIWTDLLPLYHEKEVLTIGMRDATASCLGVAGPALPNAPVAC